MEIAIFQECEPPLLGLQSIHSWLATFCRPCNVSVDDDYASFHP